MPIKTIGDRIIADASAEAERLRAGAKKTAAQISAEAKAEAERYIEDALTQAERAGAQKKKQRLAAAGLAARDRVIAAKQTIIDNAFSRAKELLEDVSEDNYTDMLAGLIAGGAAGGEEIVFAESDKTVAAGAVAKANSFLESKGLAPVVAGDGARPAGRGFILRSGSIEESFLLSALLDSAREELEAEVAQIIFGAGN